VGEGLTKFLKSGGGGAHLVAAAVIIVVVIIVTVVVIATAAWGYFAAKMSAYGLIMFKYIPYIVRV
jgi:hypothetical protein